MFKYCFTSESNTMCFAFVLLFITMSLSLFQFVYCYGLYFLLLIIIIINQYYNCFSNHYDVMICGLSFEFIYVNDYTSTVRNYCGVLWCGLVSGLNLKDLVRIYPRWVFAVMTVQRAIALYYFLNDLVEFCIVNFKLWRYILLTYVALIVFSAH